MITLLSGLLVRWAEPHRRYHTTAHLGAVLRVVEAHADLAEDPDAVRLAAWFHDAVYDPRAPDNEARSADLAGALLVDLDPRRVAEVRRLVLLTAGHRVGTGDTNGGLLADADLAILAAPPAEYAVYAAAVRQEYAFVPDGVFRPARREILQRLLDLPALYHVVPDRAAWTAQAHTNLASELDALQSADRGPALDG